LRISQTLGTREEGQQWRPAWSKLWQIVSRKHGIENGGLRMSYEQLLPNR